MPWDKDNQVRSSYLLGFWLSVVVAAICLFARTTPVDGRAAAPPAPAHHTARCVHWGQETAKR